MDFLIISSLWWTSVTLSRFMHVGNQSEYTPTKTYIILLLVLGIPNIGVFAFPVVELIWGQMKIMNLIGQSLLSLFIGIVAGNLIFKKEMKSTLILLITNPLSMIMSLCGLAMLIMRIKENY